MKKNTKAKVSVLITMLLCGFVVLECLGSILELVLFENQERAAAPKFDALNQAVLDEFPPPTGVVVLSRLVTGSNITPEHGRVLSMHYSMGQMTAEEIRSYYDDLLSSKGWQFYPTDNSEHFFHNTACLDLVIYPEESPAKYLINIWYDFWSQPFSPFKPNLMLSNMVEFSEAYTDKCHSPFQ